MGTVMKYLGALPGPRRHRVRLRGFLGVELLDKEDAEYPVVKSVLADGPAAKAGLKAGDKVTHFQGRSVQNADDVQARRPKLKAGDRSS